MVVGVTLLIWIQTHPFFLDWVSDSEDRLHCTSQKRKNIRHDR